MKKIVILTGSELRHVFFRKYIGLNKNIQVLNSYCEGDKKSLRVMVEKNSQHHDLRLNHLEAREQSEKDFFELFIHKTEDKSNPIYVSNEEDINSQKYVDSIIASNPDLIIAYGCSIIKDPLINAFKGRFLNVHLGLSPYYRGSGTNYWPLVNNEPEYVGLTFMHIDAGIDTGKIIHQVRAKYSWGDTPSLIGNRLIREMSQVYSDIITNFDSLANVPQLEPQSTSDKYYKQKDYTEESVKTLYNNFSSGMIDNYLQNKEQYCKRVPIITNDQIVGN